MGQPELADDARFATHLARGENQEEIEGIVARLGAERDAPPRSTTSLNDAGVICGPIYTIADIFEDEHFWAREMLVEHEDPEFGEYIGPGIVPKFSETPGAVRWSATWEEGSHNRGGLRRAARALRRRDRRARGGGRAVMQRHDLRRRRRATASRTTRRSSSRTIRAELVNRLARRGRCRGSRRSASSTRRACRRWPAPRRSSRRSTARPGVVYAGLVAQREGLRPAASRPASTRCTSRSPSTETFNQRNQNATRRGVARGRRADRRARARRRDPRHRDDRRLVRLPVRGRGRPGTGPRARRAASPTRAPTRSSSPTRSASACRARCATSSARASRSAGRSASTCTTRATPASRTRSRRVEAGRDGARRVGRRHRRLPVRAARDRQHLHRGSRLPAPRRGRSRPASTSTR